MAQNLVPLYIDKISGDIVASDNNSSNGNNSPSNTGYEHIQLSPLLSWIIPHNANTKKLICQVYDNNDIYTFPDTIKIVDDNVIKVSFSTPMSGSAKIVFF